ncbi:MAG: hypothetical protein EAZ55_07520 [Cytophagales bacterium]|nr:MAG: hypothetical protein EAZ55_07520 [Cytophagales bacterium]
MPFLFFFIFLQTLLPDGAPYYQETNPNFWIMEPWNALSSLTFWIPVFYWYARVKPHFKHYWILTFSLPLLFLGGLGSALFHAFRVSRIFLALDVLPILLLTLLVSIYFWQKLLGSWLGTIALMIGFMLLSALIINIPAQYLSNKINILYLLRGITLFLPMVIFLFRTQFLAAPALLISIVWFIAALMFRQIDKDVHLHQMEIGSHWLWHISTAVGAFYLGKYLFVINEKKDA